MATPGRSVVVFIEGPFIRVLIGQSVTPLDKDILVRPKRLA
jgi:hypothetical protein